MPTNENHKQEVTSVFDLGTWVGRKQAFGLIASKCSAAEADCLRNIRENKRYRALEVSWEQFCREYAGVSRAFADKLIRQLEEFGPEYFQLAGVTRITPEEYRLIAPAVTPQGVSYDGEVIPIESENASRLAQAIAALRRNASVPKTAPEGREVAFVHAEKQLDAAVTELERFGMLSLDLGDRMRLQSAASLAQRRLAALVRAAV